MARGKMTYILVCGVKEQRCGEWVQMRGRTSPYNYSALKKPFNRYANYTDVLATLKDEFTVEDDGNLDLHVLVDMENNEIDDPENFTIYEYIQNYKFRATRKLYLKN